MISVQKIKHDISFGRQKVPIPSPYGISRDVFSPDEPATTSFFSGISHNEHRAGAAVCPSDFSRLTGMEKRYYIISYNHCDRSMNPGRSSRKRALTLPAPEKRRTDENEANLHFKYRAWHQRLYRGHFCRFLRQEARRPDRAFSGMAAQGMMIRSSGARSSGRFFLALRSILWISAMAAKKPVSHSLQPATSCVIHE